MTLKVFFHKFIFRLIMAVGVPAALIGGVFLMVFITTFPISYFMGWI